jgi:hypothetical protein
MGVASTPVPEMATHCSMLRLHTWLAVHLRRCGRAPAVMHHIQHQQSLWLPAHSAYNVCLQQRTTPQQLLHALPTDITPLSTQPTPTQHSMLATTPAAGLSLTVHFVQLCADQQLLSTTHNMHPCFKASAHTAAAGSMALGNLYIRHNQKQQHSTSSRGAAQQHACSLPVGACSYLPLTA